MPIACKASDDDTTICTPGVAIVYEHTVKQRLARWIEVPRTETDEPSMRIRVTGSSSGWRIANE